MKIKRITALLLCLILLLSLIPSSVAEKATITGYLVRLRVSASSRARVLDAFPKGTSVTVLERGDLWTKVRVRGKTGYMMSRYLSGGSSSSGGSSYSGSTSGGIIMYVNTGTANPLHLRAEASASSVSLGKFRNGTAVTVLKRGRYWTRVSVKGRVGYMGSQYLSYTKP